MKKLITILMISVILLGQACTTVDTLKPTIPKPPVKFTINN